MARAALALGFLGLGWGLDLGGLDISPNPESFGLVYAVDGNSTCELSTDCGDVFSEKKRCGLSQCSFAKSCGDDGNNPYLEFYACEATNGFFKVLYVLVLVVWMVLLFVLLGSTADDYFAPTLEQFSRDLGLPPRFAGVTLLALGNGAPDASATISAIGNGGDGYIMSLGALTGAGMFVGTVVAGAVMLYAKGVRARGALVRDVAMYGFSCAVVVGIFLNGTFTYYYVTMLLVMYGAFVCIVLVADVYHRKVVLPRVNRDMARRAERMFLELESMSTAANAGSVIANRESFDSMEYGADATEMGEADGDHDSGIGRVGQVLEAFSNYAGDAMDSPTTQATTTPNSENSSNAALNAAQTGWADDYMLLKGDGNNQGYTYVFNDEDDDEGDLYMRMEAEPDGAGDELDMEVHFGGLAEGGDDDSGDLPILEELRNEVASEVAGYREMPLHEKALFVLEAPFTVMRKMSIPMTAEETYSRAFLVLSVFLLPLWLCYYYDAYGSAVGRTDSSAGLPVPLLMFLVSGPLAGAVAKTTTSAHPPEPKAYAAVIAMGGFVVAATWIDVLADNLVSVLQLFGLCLGIPSSVLGLTLLAWGNSIGDLSTNISMAKRGLANMAITACFAGPVFNMLVGLGCGFGFLLQSQKQTEVDVSLPVELVVGFLFVIGNCIMLLAFGMFFRGKVPPLYGYIGLALYVVYLATVISLSFSEEEG